MRDAVEKKVDENKGLRETATDVLLLFFFKKRKHLKKHVNAMMAALRLYTWKRGKITCSCCLYSFQSEESKTEWNKGFDTRPRRGNKSLKNLRSWINSIPGKIILNSVWVFRFLFQVQKLPEDIKNYPDLLTKLR